MPDTAPVLPEQLPIEDHDNGLYVHRAGSQRDMPGATKVTTILGPDGEARYLVDAVQFMELQRERDNYRRSLALINAWRMDVIRGEGELTRLLSAAGFSDKDGEAMLDIICQVRSGALS